MNCLHCNKHLYSYCDGELAPQLMLEMERHLAECPSCRYQYELTMMENHVLCDTSDVPALSPDFNQRVMQAIIAENNPILPGHDLSTSKERRFPFRRSSMFIISAVAVVLLALCINLPDMLSSGRQKLAQTNNSSNVQVSDSLSKAPGTKAVTDNGQDKQIQIGSTATPEYGSTPEYEISIPDDNFSLTGATRMTISEAGRADRIPTQSKALSISSLAVKNVPDQYILLSQNSSTENMVEYLYQTADGAETLTIQLRVPNENCVYADAQALQEDGTETDNVGSNDLNENLDLGDVQAAQETYPSAGIASSTDEAEPVNVNRETEIDGQTITIIFSGNINSDDLNSLADQIILSKTP